MKIPYSFLKLNKYSLVIPTVITTQTVHVCVWGGVHAQVHACSHMHMQDPLNTKNKSYNLRCNIICAVLSHSVMSKSLRPHGL